MLTKQELSAVKLVFRSSLMDIFRRVYGVTLHGKLKVCEIRKPLYVEPLLRTGRPRYSCSVT